MFVFSPPAQSALRTGLYGTLNIIIETNQFGIHAQGNGHEPDKPIVQEERFERVGPLVPPMMTSGDEEDVVIPCIAGIWENYSGGMKAGRGRK